MDQRFSRRYLKVKIKSLAQEARIIRLEELRSRGELRNSLHLHRVLHVRSEARSTHLAYGLLRGRRYDQLEPGCRELPDATRVIDLLRKYGPSCESDPRKYWLDQFFNWQKGIAPALVDHGISKPNGQRFDSARALQTGVT